MLTNFSLLTTLLVSSSAMTYAAMTYVGVSNLASKNLFGDSEAWNAFSAKTINEVSQYVKDPSRIPPIYFRLESHEEIDKRLEFYSLYKYLAHKRHEIADKLGRSDNNQKRFGIFRGEHTMAYETIYPTAEFGPWKDQNERLYPMAKEFLGNAKRRKIVSPFEKQEYTPRYGPSCGDDQHILDPINHSRGLALLQKYDERNDITITYANINKYNLAGDFLVANDYYCDIKHAKSFDDTKVALGKLMHLMAHIMPVRRGNSAIMDWFARGIVMSKNYILGPWDLNEASWVLQALVSPDREEYATKWFAKHVTMEFRGWHEAKDIVARNASDEHSVRAVENH